MASNAENVSIWWRHHVCTRLCMCIFVQLVFANYWWYYVFLLQKLILSRNNIEFIHRFAFKGLNTLNKLDISDNRLTRAPSLTGLRFTLRELILTWNYIKHIENSYFDLCINIKHIYISYNKLTQFPILKNVAKTIVVFKVSGNNISNANFIYGNSFPKLLILGLESNQIEMFCPPPGNFAPILHSIYLQRNKLSRIYFPYESHRPWVNVFLANNPWHCNGSLGWIQQCEFQDVSNIMVCMGWLSLRGMLCESPPESQGLTLKEAGIVRRFNQR